MTAPIQDATRGAGGDLLELYCGNGNFTLPLAANFGQVVATEVGRCRCHMSQHPNNYHGHCQALSGPPLS